MNSDPNRSRSSGAANPFASVYNRPEVVAQCRGDALDKSEGVFFLELARRTATFAMLDLGVGAGRTTAAFARLAGSYLGIDLAPRMIEACRERFGAAPHCSFRVGDAADLGHLPDGSFDTVLFSHNGIDCLAPDRRPVCLRAIRRLLRAGGVFMFSAHNLQAIDVYFRTPPVGSEEAGILTAGRRGKIARYNDAPASYATRDWALFWDGVYGDEGELRHVYIRPRHQIGELRTAGFPNVRALSTVTGRDLCREELDTVRELSVAYLCELDE